MPFLVKLPGYMVHLWLPKAHVEAPVTGSILLASLLLKLGLVGLYRVLRLCSSVALYVRVVLLLGGFIRVAAILSVVDLKGLVAYSSIGHIAPAGSVLLLRGVYGTKVMVYILVAHGVVRPLMFFLVTHLYRVRGSRRVILNQGIILIFPVVSFL